MQLSRQDLRYVIAGFAACMLLLWGFASTSYVGRFPYNLIQRLQEGVPFAAFGVIGVIAGLRLVAHGWKLGVVPVFLSGLFLTRYISQLIELIRYIQRT